MKEYVQVFTLKVVLIKLALISGLMNAWGEETAIESHTRSGIQGVVHNIEGTALEGVMVTLVEPEFRKTTTRYTQVDGRYTFTEIADSVKAVRFRLTGYREITIPIEDIDALENLRLEKATRDELLIQLPASAWTERVALDDDATRREFRVQCMMCHQQGYPTARWPQDREQWYAVFDRMAHKRALLTEETRRSVADALLEAYSIGDNKALPDTPAPANGEETHIEITEWRINNPNTSMHDVAVGPDGLIYGVDGEDDHIWRLNPETNNIEILKHLKPKNRGDMKLLLHTVFQAPDGAMWFTYAAGNLVARYDVEKDEMKVWELSFLDGIYPHTMRFDSTGQVWFTVTITNQLGTIDPESDEVKLYDMPSRNWRQKMATWAPVTLGLLWAQKEFEITTTNHPELMPIAYGIDVTPDDKIWFSQFNNRRIGYFDKESEEFHMVDTPFGGPRRFRADSKGDLWIPAYTDGLIYRYSPESETFTPYELPTGRGDSIYALAVDPRDDTVWACGSNSDTMLHLFPDTGKVVRYPLPSRVTFCREISFAEDGSVWTSYSNYPSFSIEGGASAFVKLKVESSSDSAGEQ